MIPETELFAGLNHLYWHLVLIALGGLILLVVVISVISRTITKPLRKLARTAAAIAQGNLNVELAEPRGRDEIDSLTRSFREMQEALQEYMANLATTIAAKEKIESELKIARSIQMSFLPKRFPPLAAGEFVEIAALLEPAQGWRQEHHSAPNSWPGLCGHRGQREASRRSGGLGSATVRHRP